MRIPKAALALSFNPRRVMIRGTMTTQSVATYVGNGKCVSAEIYAAAVADDTAIVVA